MKKLILLITLLFVSLNTQATLLSIHLNQDSYQIGDVLTADLVISDIAEDTSAFQKLLASFDLNISWDNSIIEFTSSRFGNKLNVGDGGSDQHLDVMADSLGLSEISHAWWDELLVVQDGLSSFVLASVDFIVIDNGSGTLDFSNVAFGDDFGDDFTDVSSSGKAYSVTSGTPVDVPEPASIILVLMAIVLFVRQQKMQ
jgi:hypothetical protein